LTVTIGQPIPSSFQKTIQPQILGNSTLNQISSESFLYRAQKSVDETPIAGNSAESTETKNQAEIATAAAMMQQQEIAQTELELKQQKIKLVRQILEKHNSPMVDNAQDFVEAAEKHNLDWRLVVSIAGVESTFGKRVAPNTNNPFGWGGGYIKFATWKDAIYTVSKGLSEKYVKDGLDTPLKMQARYAPPSSTWGQKVNYFMDKVYPTNLVEVKIAVNSTI
jgi:hypothetical protein